jgi:hypothetical protein
MLPFVTAKAAAAELFAGLRTGYYNKPLNLTATKGHGGKMCAKEIE